MEEEDTLQLNIFGGEDNTPKRKPEVDEFESSHVERSEKRRKVDKTPTKPQEQPALSTTPKKHRYSNENRKSIEPLKPVVVKKVEKKEKSKESEDGTWVFGNLAATFDEFGLADRLLKCIKEKLELNTPTHIQQLGISYLLHSNQDTLIKAETGSGKTLTYLLPMIQRLQSMSSEKNIFREEGTYAVVLAPTRELCLQIFATLSKLCQPFHWFVPGVVMGGEKKKSEKARLRKGVTILVATPGRLLDHLNSTHAFKVSNLQMLVLDEADRLLDLGFEKDISAIINALRTRNKKGPEGFQSVLISATLQDGIQRLAGENLRNPKFITTDAAPITPQTEDSTEPSNGDGSSEPATFSAPKQLHQFYIATPSKERLVTLAAFLRSKSANNSKMIVFFSNCDSVDFHYALLTQVKIPLEQPIEELKSRGEDESKKPPPSEPLIPARIYRLHGELKQVDRTRVYMDFNSAKSGILLCTDVAARGMDFPGVNWIIQYDPPGETREYIHRIGRTARVGKKGQSLLFLLPAEIKYIELLNSKSIEVEELDLQQVQKTLPVIPEMKGFHPAGAMQVFLERLLQSEKTLVELARRGFASFVRAYSTHSKETKYIFHIKNLHLGHTAKAFALREQPKEVIAHEHKKGQQQKKEHLEKVAKRKTDKTGEKLKETAYVSEFDTGF